MRLLTVLAMLVVTVSLLVDATVTCGHTRLQSVGAREWHASCADGSAYVAFDPSRVQSFFLDHESVVRVSNSSSEVYLSASLGSVGPLVSSTLTVFTLKAEPLWVHKTPVTIAASAFAELSALETLTLQDVPLADPQLHLRLPRSLKKLVVVGCKLEQLSFEIVGGGNATSLLEIDLHTNELVEIPTVFYALPQDVINLDVRLNKLSTISVSASHAPKLKQWMKDGVLQIDNLKNPCPASTKKETVQGLSQEFTVCVPVNSSMSKETRSRAGSDTATASGAVGNVTHTSTGETANDADDAPDPPPATIHSPYEESALVTSAPSPTEKHDSPSSETTVSKTATKQSSISTVYVALVCIGVVSTLLMTFSFVLVMRHRQHHADPKTSEDFDGHSKSRSSLLTFAATEGLGVSCIERRSSGASSSSSESLMVTPLPDFKARRPMNRAGRSTSEAATPINGNNGNALYTTISTPHNLSHGYTMNRSLQSLTGVSHYSITSLEKESALRRANKDKLRTILSELTKRRGALEVNKTMFVCFGEISETDAGAIMVRCYPVDASTLLEAEVPHPLWLKVYVEQDVRVAIREYRALLVMQSNTCKQFVSQMVATEMEKKINGLKCAVIVAEMGSATTFRHIVRGQIDRVKQLEVVQQLHAVVKALDCLHERQFIHGGLHLDALVVHPSEENRLKFRDLEHAARLGDIIQSPLLASSNSTLEYLPPEMARHLMCCGEAPRKSNLDTMETDSYQILRASTAYDVWSFGVLILKVYANSKKLDEFDECETANDFYLKISDEAFGFERSLQLYVHHEDVRDLARVCLRRDPRKRPKLAGLLAHRVFRAYDRLEEGDLVASFHAHRLKIANKTREALPPTLWIFLPPRDLGLMKTRSVDEWVVDITDFQQQQRQANRFRSSELMFPLLFLCENSKYVSTPCSKTGFHHSRFHLPASLLSLAMPLVQESTLFLEAKAILSQDPKLNVAQVSGLGTHQWNELMKFYRALEKMMLAPISSFSLLLLKPLEKMLADQEHQQAQQVLDELKCLVFSQEKRDHVLSLLDILKTISVNSELDQDDEQDDDDDDDASSVSEDESDAGSSSRPTKEWSRLRKCDMDHDASASMPTTRWLCRRHWECEMECEV